MNITIVNVTKTNPQAKNGRGTYGLLEVAYKDESGTLKGHKLLDFNNKDVFNRLAVAQQGECFSVRMEKDQKGYWQWVEVSRQDAAVATSAPAADKPAAQQWKPTYETPEERAQRQIYIVRQSSITSAVNLLGQGASVEDVLKVARQFEDHVFDTGGFNDFQDDIPE